MLLSVIIPVYNDWPALQGCLQSLMLQTDAPEFEVIVIDDGSTQAGSETIERGSYAFPLTIVHQSHAGVSSARNRGVQLARGDVLLFTDADCRLRTNCLAALRTALLKAPAESCFQLRLEAEDSSRIAEAEHLRLRALQNHLVHGQSIRYLNTAGFAIRRSQIGESQLFDPQALRAEDTWLLANLMRSGELPYFVPGAVVKHAIQLSFFECLKKDIRSARLETPTYSRIRSLGVHIRMCQRERWQMAVATWKASKGKRLAWAVLMCRQIVRRAAGLVCRCATAFEEQRSILQVSTRRALARVSGPVVRSG